MLCIVVQLGLWAPRGLIRFVFPLREMYCGRLNERSYIIICTKLW